MSQADVESIAEQVRELKYGFAKVIGVGVLVALSITGAAFTVWAKISVQENTLADMKSARVTERIAALEAQKFTAADGAALAASLTTQLQAITNTVTDLKVVLAQSVREREAKR